MSVLTHGLRLLCVVLAALVLRAMAPDHEPPVIQPVTMFFAIVVSLVVVLKHRGQYVRNHAFRWELVVPLVFLILLPVFQLFLSETFRNHLGTVLLPITIVFSVAGTWFGFTPYTGKQVSEPESQVDDIELKRYLDGNQLLWKLLTAVFCCVGTVVGNVELLYIGIVDRAEGRSVNLFVAFGIACIKACFLLRVRLVSLGRQ